jgi:drug/metabolite transporter (DMT)-like permease
MERGSWKPQAVQLFWAALTGGAANACFIAALMFGDVVRVMLMFYLAPVWGVLGARLFLGEPITRWRLIGVAMAVIGAVLVLGGSQLLSTPVSRAELLGLTAGLLYAVQNIIFRSADRVPVLSKALSVFTGCTAVSAVLFPIAGGTQPPISITLSFQLIAFSGIWMVLAMWTTMYGVTHLGAGRAAVLLVFELAAAVASATIIGAERLSALEWLGAALITAAALLEARSASPEERKSA